MRSRTGCQACRDRHIKCVKVTGSSKCQKCHEHKRACVHSSPHRFKPVTSVSLKVDEDKTTKQSLTYDDGQVWVNIPSTVQFVASGPESDEEDEDCNETTELGNDDKQNGKSEILGNGRPEPEFAINTNVDVNHPAGLAKATSPLSSRHDDEQIPIARQRSINEVISPTRSHALDLSRVSSHQSPPSTTHSLNRSPFLPNTRSKTNTYTSPALLASSPAVSYTPSWPFTTAHESRLFFHYIKELSPWVDICDPQAHFGRELPRRVVHHPILAQAMLALAARHISMLTHSEDEESPRYVDNALKMLITALEDPLGHWDENLLAAVVILRLHEEMSQDDDQRCHLFGTRRILDSISSYASDGGLRESASWVSLRQHIYISLTKQHPMDIDLTNFVHSSVFDDMSDEAWANRMIYIFAKTLDFAFQKNSAQHEPDLHRWAEVEAEVEAWLISKPWYFNPLYINTSASFTPEDGSKIKERMWPELLMAHGAQAVGMQYYYLARLVLAIYDPRLAKLSFNSHRARKASEKTVLESVRMIVGFASSNEDTQNAMFQASHVLSACGSYLTDPTEQDAAIAYLRRIEELMGWRTSKIIDELREQWS